MSSEILAGGWASQLVSPPTLEGGTKIENNNPREVAENAEGSACNADSHIVPRTTQEDNEDKYDDFSQEAAETHAQ